MYVRLVQRLHHQARTVLGQKYDRRHSILVRSQEDRLERLPVKDEGSGEDEISKVNCNGGSTVR